MPAVPQLTFEEARVFGSLIEKSQATPEYYPLTLNALMNACNQKSSREPVTSFDEDIVEAALEGLREKGLVAYASGAGRALKYIHRAGQSGLGLSPAEAAALSLVILRGPQTAGEIKARAGRQFNFSTIELVEQTIAGLGREDRAYLEEAPRRAGQKEPRYRHRLFEWPDEDETAPEPFSAAGATLRSELEELRSRLESVEERNALLVSRIDALEADIAGIKADLYAA